MDSGTRSNSAAADGRRATCIDVFEGDSHVSQFEKILHRGPNVDPVESERVRALAIARLSTMSAHPEVAQKAAPASAPPIVVEAVPAASAEPDVLGRVVESGPSTIWDPPADGGGSPEPRDLPRDEGASIAEAPGEPPVVATAYCPSCAFLLHPAPSEDRPCPRCDRPIVVRVLADGRLVYLTEAAIEVFEAERIREANERRWTEQQAAWLGLAGTVGVPMTRIDRLGRTGPSEAAVDAARDLYLTASEAAAEKVQSHGEWDVAAALRRSQANDLQRIGGAPMPPEPAAVELYRKAALTELRGIGAITRSAALLSARCCDECRADGGAVVRISTEVRRTRLPHPTCPEVLCGCRWDLAPADVQAVVRYLERNGRPIADPMLAPNVV